MDVSTQLERDEGKTLDAALKSIRDAEYTKDKDAVREGVYALALHSTLAVGRKEVAGTSGACDKLFELMGNEDVDVARWATLGVGSLSMLQEVREALLRKSAPQAVVETLSKELQGADASAVCYACLTMGNLAVEDTTRDVMAGDAGIFAALGRLLGAGGALTRRYAVGAVRNISVHPIARKVLAKEESV
eukprot:CAMPEP_0206266406 /NCGR_PEP_ID=MMETSP0047_2-20121206/30557_1 /ASSEMBLY_ACC=CAM_ASM_000192 /TAXON_ID=195065 /ORGANISM="Chroomonas mesostigmatica_cf, Strain CCMP1168" /LENGTH=189 /DNA_ID=CAMNT_0053694457 /DNA_START=87 /DNA_END=653 /DNA_ORIENTATION=-